MTSEEQQEIEESHPLHGVWALLGWLNTDRLLIIVLFLGLFAMAVRLPTDTDTWWHIRSGQYIVETGQIPFHDPFSHTVLGTSWTDHSWLAQILLFGTYQEAGVTGLAIGLAIVVVLALWIVYHQCESNIYIRAFTVVLAALTSALYWIARPQILSFLLASVFLYILYLYKRRSVNRLYLIPLLFVLWVNVHGGFIVGFLLLLIYVLGEAANNIAGLGNAPILSYRQILSLVLTAAVSVIAVLLNPNTYKMLTYPFFTVSMEALKDYIQEWGSPDFHQVYQQPFLWMFFVLLVVVALSRFRVDFTDLFLVGAFGYMSFMAVRNVALFALVAAPVLARHAESTLVQLLDAVRNRTRWGPWIDKLLAHRFATTPLMVAVNWTLLTLVVLTALGISLQPLLPAYAEKEMEQELPVAAADFIEDNGLPGNLFNSYNWGGYLIWRLYPEYPVFIDGRTDLYNDSLMRRYLDVMAARGDWRETLTQYKVNTILVERGSTLGNALKYIDGWVLVYADDLALIFARDIPEHQLLIDTHRIESGP